MGAPAAKVHLLPGRFVLWVESESKAHQEALRTLVASKRVRDEAAHRSLAAALKYMRSDETGGEIRVLINGLEVGAFAAEEAQAYGPGLLFLQDKYGRAIALPAQIHGRPGPTAELGVSLSIDPAVFGDPLSNDPDVYEVMQDRIGEDGHVDDDDGIDDLRDDFGGVPASITRLGAIKLARFRLAQERDPRGRFFAYNSLAQYLYFARRDIDWAMDEFQKVCRQLDAEMDELRPLLLRHHHRVGPLWTYQRLSIDKAKEKEWAEVFWWCKRALALAGDSSFEAEVDGFTRRLATARRMLEKEASPKRRGRPPKTADTNWDGNDAVEKRIQDFGASLTIARRLDSAAESPWKPSLAAPLRLEVHDGILTYPQETWRDPEVPEEPMKWEIHDGQITPPQGNWEDLEFPPEPWVEVFLDLVLTGHPGDQSDEIHRFSSRWIEEVAKDAIAAPELKILGDYSGVWIAPGYAYQDEDGTSFLVWAVVNQLDWELELPVARFGLLVFLSWPTAVPPDSYGEQVAHRLMDLHPEFDEDLMKIDDQWDEELVIAQVFELWSDHVESRAPAIPEGLGPLLRVSSNSGVQYL